MRAAARAGLAVETVTEIHGANTVVKVVTHLHERRVCRHALRENARATVVDAAPHAIYVVKLPGRTIASVAPHPYGQNWSSVVDNLHPPKYSILQLKAKNRRGHRGPARDRQSIGVVEREISQRHIGSAVGNSDQKVRGRPSTHRLENRHAFACA